MCTSLLLRFIEFTGISLQLYEPYGFQNQCKAGFLKQYFMFASCRSFSCGLLNFRGCVIGRKCRYNVLSDGQRASKTPSHYTFLVGNGKGVHPSHSIHTSPTIWQVRERLEIEKRDHECSQLHGSPSNNWKWCW